MSEQEKFLARWSRRKLDGETVAPATGEATKTAEPDEGREAVRDPAAGSQLPTPAKEEAVFDPASLPSLESIGPNSDIRAFLRPGVPTALSRAALRRAWSADPAIRDFVGLAENAWDFTATNEAMGFGPLNLNPREIADQLASVFGEVRPEPETPPNPTEPVAQIPQPAPKDTLPAPERTALPAPEREDEPESTGASESSDVNDPLLQRSNDDGEPTREQSAGLPAGRRSHGGALPE